MTKQYNPSLLQDVFENPDLQYLMKSRKFCFCLLATNKHKAITKSKYYFFDIRVARKAIGANPPVDGTADFGKAFEN